MARGGSNDAIRLSSYVTTTWCYTMKTSAKQNTSEQHFCQFCQGRKCMPGISKLLSPWRCCTRVASQYHYSSLLNQRTINWAYSSLTPSGGVSFSLNIHKCGHYCILGVWNPNRKGLEQLRDCVVGSFHVFDALCSLSIKRALTFSRAYKGKPKEPLISFKTQLTNRPHRLVQPTSDDRGHWPTNDNTFKEVLHFLWFMRIIVLLISPLYRLCWIHKQYILKERKYAI